MNIQTVLYYRYLFRQSISLFITSICIALIISLILFLVKNSIIFKIIGSIIWFLPIIFLVILIVFFVKYKNYKKQLKNQDLFEKITNKKIRELVVKSGKKIKILIPSKNQDQEFFKIIYNEIEKQKSLLKIMQKNNYGKK